MKISTKISIIVLVFIAVIAANGSISLRMLGRTGGELKGVVSRDMVLIESATAITRYQLQKAVVFERIRRIAEELAFQNTVPARKEHLLFHLKLGRTNLDDLARDGALNIVSAKVLVSGSLRSLRQDETREELEKIAGTLKEIERAHIHYDALISEMFRSFDAGKYDLTSDEIAQSHRDERKLTSELQNLIDEVDRYTKGSLAKAGLYQKTAETILWIVLLVSMVAGLVLTWWVLNAINRPLKVLVGAAHRIGAGDLDVSLPASDRDEFGEVSGAFNKMAARLKISTEALEQQSDALRSSLEVTELQKKDLEKVNRELDRFVQTVSHDIRSPLMGVVWYAEFLKTHYVDRLDQKGQDSLDGVVRSVDRANALIKDLLTLTRLSRVRNPYAFVQTGALVDEVAANLEYKIRQCNVDLRIQQNMPMILCDGIKIKEVVLNLITNAIKFSSGDGRNPVVEVGYKEQISAHEFFVRDNGVGIAPEHHDEIFAIFKRLDTSGKYEGTGVGLSIVKSVIDDHGGSVWVISDVGRGSEFHFTIPKALENHAQPRG